MDTINSPENNDKNITNNDINNIPLDQKTNIIDDDDKKPFFLMTLEDNTGKCQEIKIYQNTNPSELAYNFCKENNLDFCSMKYIKSNIKSIIKKFNEPQQKALRYNNSNNSIKEEEDEDDYLTEGTMRSNENQKNQENNEEQNNESDIQNDENDENEENEENEDNNNQENDNNNEEIINISNNSENKNLNNSKKNEDLNNSKKIEDLDNSKKKEDSDNSKKKEDSDNSNKNGDSDNSKKKEDLDNSKKEDLDKEKKDENNLQINNYVNSESTDTEKNKQSTKSNNDKVSNSSDNFNSYIKSKNNIGKFPIKINQISPKQIEINENVQKIINNTNKSSKDFDNSNNVNSLNVEKNSNISKSNYNFINNTDRSRNSGYISIFDKESKENNSNCLHSREKTKLSELNSNIFIDSPGKNSEKIDKKRNNRKKDLDTIKNNNNTFNIKSFGESYINLNKKLNNEKEISKSITQSVDSVESGVPVLNNEVDTEKDDKTKEVINNHLTKGIISRTEEIKEDNNNMNKSEKKINKEILINKMKKLDYNLPKKNIKKNKEINKLLYLIKNSCYNINKKMKNKIIKEKTNNVDAPSDVNKLKIKESNSLDINYEISRNLDNDFNNNMYGKKNNINKEKSNENNNHINTNFNSYIENNRINNNTKNNIIASTSNNELKQNNTNPITRKFFYSNPNLSSNQETINHSNAIFNVKHDFNNKRKYENTNKSKSFGKDKNKKKSNSKNIYQRKNTENITNNRTKTKNNVKEKNKKCSVKNNNKCNCNCNYFIRNNLTAPSPMEIKNTNYVNIKSCQTPPTKKVKNTYRTINTFFSELISTISKDSRNGYTTRDHYFKKNKEMNKASKSVSELANTVGKKSNYRMLLSNSNYKNIKPNYVVKKIRYNTKNKLSKDNKSIKRNSNHYYIHSLKMINNNDIKSQTNHSNNNYFNSINYNKNTITNNKSNGRNKTLGKKQLERIKLNNNHVICTINDYNFNNNNSYIKKLINSTFQNFLYDSSDTSKSEDKIRKMSTMKQLTSPHRVKYIGIRTKKRNNNAIIEYKCDVGKIQKILLNNSGSNKSYNNNDNGSNININNLININNYQKNKNININYNKTGNNHYVKNSRLKKNKVSNRNNANSNNNNNNRNNIMNNKRLINFSNELANYYLNTEIFKNNITYSNVISNNLTLSTFDLSNDEKTSEEILINIFNKIFIFLNKDKSNEITLLDSNYKERMSYFPKNIRKTLNIMIEVLFKRKKNYFSNNSVTNTIKVSNENVVKIDKNSFINEMLYIYKHLSNENRKKILLSKDEINKIIQDNLLGRSQTKNSQNINKTDCPKSCHKKSQYKTKTENINNNIRIKSD